MNKLVTLFVLAIMASCSVHAGKFIGYLAAPFVGMPNFALGLESGFRYKDDLGDIDRLAYMRPKEGRLRGWRSFGRDLGGGGTMTYAVEGIVSPHTSFLHTIASASALAYLVELLGRVWARRAFNPSARDQELYNIGFSNMNAAEISNFEKIVESCRMLVGARSMTQAGAHFLGGLGAIGGMASSVSGEGEMPKTKFLFGSAGATFLMQHLLSIAYIYRYAQWVKRMIKKGLVIEYKRKNARRMKKGYNEELGSDD